MTDWFRSWHGAPTDNKWLLIAKRANVRAIHVSGTWWALLDHASQHAERGRVDDFDIETFALFSGLDEEHVSRIVTALGEKRLIVNGRIANWGKRQPKREDEGAAERKRRSRANNGENPPESDPPGTRETPSKQVRHAMSRNVTPEKKREENSSDASASGTVVPFPAADFCKAVFDSGVSLLVRAGNPMRKSGRFYELFTRFRHRWITRTVDTRTAKAANQKQILDMIADYGEDSDHVKVNVKGEFPDVEDDVIIPLPLIEAAQRRKVNDDDNNRFKPIWSVDPARSPLGDRSTLCKRRHRKLMEPVRAWRGLNTMQLAGRIIHEFEETPANELPSHIVVDVIGIGAGVVDRLREHDVLGPLIVALNVAETLGVDKAKYPRLRDQLWFKAAEWFSPENAAEFDDDDTAAELCNVFFSYTGAGQRKVESKDDTKERIGHSPDKADAFIGTFAVSPVSIPREMDRYERARRRAKSAGASSWAS